MSTFEPKIVAFLCNWCSYAGADLAGVSRRPYPPSLRIVRVPCSSRVTPAMILSALKAGADGVLVSGCHPGDCHYLTGNLFARRRFFMLRKLLEFVGLEPERIAFAWISASEGDFFAEVVKEFTDKLRQIGPNLKFRKVLRREPFEFPYL
ncbi:hydrogenase iron-sulfur subunit [Thermodesulfatator autotrophicus]|uniref:Methyl-viologen-reducing hydrogenase subunit delta n=1 Tax=Thermodesulfatator autotrophicus TaxID=1795632 RepID=A0A177E4C0_9BACT|nr:hydrogenase iron-sulfur subunit [Thermodesulfatator autotrophicus]OAG26765.1 methyl-viologen-reducing hydrogenase subunit delta [Thermodesulfatator autotrophicus]